MIIKANLPEQANNISAQQIRDDYQRRREQAARDAAAAASNATEQDGDEDDNSDDDETSADAAIERSRRRRRLQQEAIESIKKKKGAAKKGKDKRKAKKRKGKDKNGDDSDDSDDSNYDGGILNDLYKKAVKLPGQLENCEICDKRFTVTPYSKAGPNGGLLCTPCGKQLAAERGESSKAKKKPGLQGRKRRKIESERLDGRAPRGAKSLVQLCIEKIVQHNDDIDDLGDMPQKLLERLGEIFTKKRVMKPKTLPLFLRSEHDAVVVHDCAYMEHENFIEMIAKTPRMEKLVLANACQFKNPTMEYLIGKADNLKHIQLYAANLISNRSWSKFFATRGENLETVKLQWLDSSFEDANVAEMVSYCPSLSRLKLEFCKLLTENCLDSIMQLRNLEHLTLQFSEPVSNSSVVSLIETLGPKLQTLSLTGFTDLDDTALHAIHTHCRSLSKLRLTHNETCTDAAFASLFRGWANPPLHTIDVSRTRSVDAADPDGPDAPTGIASAAFAALMQHSAPALRSLGLASCRHVGHAALAAAFDGRRQYPDLRDVDLSFVGAVDAPVLAGLFACAPALRRVVAFGCFAIEDLVVPAGLVVIGVPRAQDAIERVGEGLGVDGALESMARRMAEEMQEAAFEAVGGNMEVDVWG